MNTFPTAQKFDTNAVIKRIAESQEPDNLWKEWKRDHGARIQSEHSVGAKDPLELNLVVKLQTVKMLVSVANTFTYIGISRLYSTVWRDNGLFTQIEPTIAMLVCQTIEDYVKEAAVDEGIMVSQRIGPGQWDDWSAWRNWSAA